jgi:hypothetical protein
MMPTEDLFRLIKVMSKSEKRYFTLWSGLQKGNKKYLLLFKAIEKQKVYDENKLKNLFLKENSISQLPVAKIYLFDLLVKSLTLYHSDRTADFSIREALHKVEVLFYKGMFEQCLKIIQKHKKIAEKLGKYSLMLELMRWERRIFGFDVDNLSLLSNAWLENAAVQKKMNKSYGYQQKNLVFWKQFNERGKTRKKQETAEFDNLFMNSLLKDEPHDLGWEAQWYDLVTHQNYYRANGNYEKSLIAAQRGLKIMDDNPDLQKEDPHKYVSSLINMAMSLQELERFNECLYYTKKLRTFVKQPVFSFYSQLQTRAYTLSYYSELEVYIRNGQIEKAIQLIPVIEKHIELPSRGISEYLKMGLYLEITYAYIIAGNYKKALLWANKILSRPSSRTDIQPIARIMNILIHYELGNTDVLESMIASAEHFLKSKDRFYEYEKEIFRMIKRLQAAGNNKTQLAIFSELKEYAQQMSLGEYGKIVLEYFDITLWVDSKLEGRTMTAIIKKRNNSQ